jgi:hypothetical protein
MGNIILVEDVGELFRVIDSYEECHRGWKTKMADNNQAFNKQLGIIVRELGV